MNVPDQPEEDKTPPAVFVHAGLAGASGGVPEHDENEDKG